MSARPDIRLPLGMGQQGLDHAWHVQLNKSVREFGHGEESSGDPALDSKSFMYEAKIVADEVPRLALLFGMERRGELTGRHRQCSHDEQGQDVPDNHLTCCLGRSVEPNAQPGISSDARNAKPPGSAGSCFVGLPQSPHLSPFAFTR